MVDEPRLVRGSSAVNASGNWGGPIEQAHRVQSDQGTQPAIIRMGVEQYPNFTHKARKELLAASWL